MNFNQKKRKLFARYELKNKVLNSIIKNYTLKPFLRWYIQTKFLKKQKINSKTKFKNICVFSGRSRSFYGFAKISRLFLRDPQYLDKIPGLTKSYW